MEGSCKTVVVRSTTTVGTLEKLFHLYDPNGKVLLHWPEFLTARYALNDFLTAPFALLGAGIPGDLRTAPSDFVGFLLTRFPTVNVVTLTESQLVKIALNAYFATKVSYWNGVAKICKELAVPYDNIRRLVEADGRVAREHLRVPGPDGEWGFGGTCLPKDTRAMRELIGRFGGDVGLLTAVLEGNARMRSEV
jgi:UDPglucose 6-dehydrogenase